MKPQDSVALKAFVEAQQLAAAGRATAARAAYRDCVARDRTFLPAWFALGQSCAIDGHFSEAHDALGHALDLAAGNPGALALVAPALAAVVASIVPRSADARLDSQLRACLDVPQVHAQSLAATLARHLLLKYPDEADEEPITRDPLWIALLTRCLNVDRAMEGRLVRLRRTLLNRHAAASTIAHRDGRTICALALQAFTGQYVWPSDAAETALAAAVASPMLVALYRPLLEISESVDLRPLKRDRLSTLLVKRTSSDLIQEAMLAEALPTLRMSSANRVSDAVRGQYEEHPYPRWQSPPVPRPGGLKRTIDLLPAVDRTALPAAFDRSLIAGSGTGYEAIGVALDDPTAAITALDLSRSSLAYGQRMAAELGIGNISFIQGDLLDIRHLGKSFSLIYSTGVLHHLENPHDGLASLAAVLDPGGLIRIGLYSERARGPIKAARELISKRGWSPIDDDIRSFRAEVLALPDDAPLARLRDSPDFYSLSGCRDLVFHVQEHRFTPLQVGDLVRSVGLTIAGLDLPDGADRQFAEQFGHEADRLDLGMWDQLEASDPTMFAGMFLVWCQKPR